jgi:hypothetical protein
MGYVLGYAIGYVVAGSVWVGAMSVTASVFALSKVIKLISNKTKH